MWSVELNEFLQSFSLNSTCSSLGLKTRYGKYVVHKLIFVQYIIFRFSGYEY
jgi:hypothetical protein